VSRCWSHNRFGGVIGWIPKPGKVRRPFQSSRNSLDGWIGTERSGSPANGLMFPSPAGKPINLDALAADVIVPVLTKAGVRWHGWHAYRRGLATNLHRLGVPDKIIQRILRHSTVAVTQSCYIKTADSDASAAMQQFGRSLEYATNMHLSGARDSGSCDQ
jgi:integrase